MAERKREMGITHFARRIKQPRGIWVKMAFIVVLGLCFVFFWSFLSSSASSFNVQRESFEDIAEPVSSRTKSAHNDVSESSRSHEKSKVESGSKSKEGKKVGGFVHKHETKKKKEHAVTHPHKKKDVPKPVVVEEEAVVKEDQEHVEAASDDSESNKEDGEEGTESDGSEGESDGNVNGDDPSASVDEEVEEKNEEVTVNETGNKRKKRGPVFDPKAEYSWRLCNTRSKHNYMPCIDNDGIIGRLQSYRHRERSCPKKPVMCLVPLPHDGYDPPVSWPESKSKILYKNVAHPKLAAYIKKHNWVNESGEYLTFPQNQTAFNGKVLQYLEFIQEMVPDIEWGKNVRIVLDIGCSESSFVAALLDKDVLTVSLGLKDDLVDLAQVALERGFPTLVSALASRRLPFPSGVFDTIHCSACGIHWHSHAMTALIASICWNILAHKTEEASEMGVRIYQKPESNDIYELRRRKNPPLCKENENPDAAWYVPMKTCLHEIPSAIEQHGAEWPEEWPKRLETYPEWLTNKEKAIGDADHWKAMVNKSYLTGLGIDWLHIRNVMDMTAIYGGFAASLVKQNVWVMNVVPVHSPDTLPFIYERGLLGIYHDWCEPFGTYPRSYDLLHADHLFSRLKNRCKQPASIVVEMDRLTRPGGWVVVRDKHSSRISSPWLDLRVFYVRISNFKVEDSTPEVLTINHIPLDPDTLLEINGVRMSMYSEGCSSQLRRDRVDKKSEEATYVSTDNIRLTGSVKFEVYDKNELVLSGTLEKSDSNGFTGESKNRWSMNCEAEITAGSGFLKEKSINGHELPSSTLPTIEVYVTGCFSGTPIILTKTLQLGFKKKQSRRLALDSIPEYETAEPQKNISSELDFQATEYGNYKEEYEGDMYWRSECIDGEMSWFNAGVRVGVGIGLGVCVGLGIGVGLLVRTYQSTTRNFRRRLL
ncbi:unnamed protein product [Thlaspi arvense]|uniref:Methyltransferase n=1 Tax=Thlaspi arvense TaxID=13288 RepID=A0AAU9RAG8_THLAR|nr:unnamed protein product [Thlaspi arvense]